MGLEKINDMRRSLGWGLDILAEKSGVPLSTLSKIAAGITKDPKLATVKSIVHCMGYTLDDLDDSARSLPVSQPPHYADLLDEYKAIVDATSEQVYKTQTIAFRASIAAPQPDILPNNVIILRSSEQPFSAGRGVYLGPEAFNTIFVERNELTEHADYAGPVEGDSMEPKYHDGDILLVSTKEYPERGEIGIFSLDGCGYVKKLGDNKLISLNPKYDPISMDESIRCNGKVIGILNPDWIKGDNQ